MEKADLKLIDFLARDAETSRIQRDGVHDKKTNPSQPTDTIYIYKKSPTTSLNPRLAPYTKPLPKPFSHPHPLLDFIPPAPPNT